GALPLTVPRTAIAADASSFVAEGAATPAGKPKPGDVNAREPDGSTPLQWAVYRRDAAEVQRLIKAGADVSLANNYGATPMSLAAATGDAEIIRLLLKAGADPDSAN